eukprot:SAG11_NODE_39351_length_234_cov_5.696296_1_plen_62_part_10
MCTPVTVYTNLNLNLNLKFEFKFSPIFTSKDGEMQIQFYYRILIIDILIQFATFLYIQNYYG